MWCEQREHLLAVYRKAMATAVAIRDRESIDQSFGEKARQIDQASAAAAKARLDLREHAEVHGCWSHAVYSSLFFRWRNQWTDSMDALNERSNVAS